MTQDDGTDNGESPLEKSRRRRESDAKTLSFLIFGFLGSILIIWTAADIATLFTPEYYTGDRRLESISSATAWIRILSGFVLIGLAGVTTFLIASGSPVFRRLNRQATNGGALSEESLEVALAEMKGIAKTITQTRVITDADRSVISSRLEEIVKSSLPKEYLARIDAKYGAAIANEKVSMYLEDALKITKSRLESFRVVLTRNAALSLAWGLTTAVFGLGALLMFLFYPPEGSWEEIKSIFHFAGRLGVVAMIEIVAFFFLSQYRGTLTDLKYINNEITNVELKLLSVIAAAKLGNNDSLEKGLAELAKTERNFVLRKGEISIFHSGQGEDLLTHAVFADLLKRLSPTLLGKH